MMAWMKMTPCPPVLFLTCFSNFLTVRKLKKESQYAVVFDSLKSTETYRSPLVEHFKGYGIKIHAGDKRYTEKKSKTECNVATPPSIYLDPICYDNVDPSNI